VYVAFARQTDNWLYDTSGFVPSAAGPIAVPQLYPAPPGDELVVPQVRVRASGAVRVASDVEVDDFGNSTSQTAYG